MKTKGRIIGWRLRYVDGGAKFEAAPVEFERSEDLGNIILKISKLGLIAGDEIRLDFIILGDDDAG